MRQNSLYLCNLIFLFCKNSKTKIENDQVKVYVFIDDALFTMDGRGVYNNCEIISVGTEEQLETFRGLDEHILGGLFWHWPVKPGFPDVSAINESRT